MSYPERSTPSSSSVAPSVDMIVAQHQIASATETFNAFLGGGMKPWMMGDNTEMVAPVPASTSTPTPMVSFNSPGLVQDTTIFPLSPSSSDQSGNDSRKRRGNHDHYVGSCKRLRSGTSPSPQCDELTPILGYPTAPTAWLDLNRDTLQNLSPNSGGAEQQFDMLNQSSINPSVDTDATAREGFMTCHDPRPYSPCVASPMGTFSPLVYVTQPSVNSPSEYDHGLAIKQTPTTLSGTSSAVTCPGHDQSNLLQQPLGHIQPTVQRSSVSKVLQSQSNLGAGGFGIKWNVSDQLLERIFMLKLPPNSLYTASSNRTNLECCIETLQNQIARPQLALLRLRLLRTAIIREDHQFLMLHQLMCLHSANVLLVPAQLQLPTLEAAMQVLGNMLGSNQRLEPSILNFFCNFPCSLSELSAKFSHIYDVYIETVRFLVQRLPNWSSLLKAYKARSLYPLAKHFVYKLGITSPTLMDLVLTIILRETWGADDWLAMPYFVRARELLGKNLNDCYAIGKLQSRSIVELDARTVLQAFSKLDTDLRQSRASLDSGSVAAALSPPFPETEQMPTLVTAATTTTPSAANLSVSFQYAGVASDAPSMTTADGNLPNRSTRNPFTATVALLPPNLTKAPLNSTPSNRRHSTNSLPSNPLANFQLMGVPPLLPFNRSILPRPYPSATLQSPPYTPLAPSSGADLFFPINFYSPSVSSNLPPAAFFQTLLAGPTPSLTDMAKNEPDSTLYQFASSFAIDPHRFKSGKTCIFKFNISFTEFTRIPATQTSSSRTTTTRKLKCGSLQYRIRVCKLLRRNDDAISDSDWFAADTQFPSTISLKLNDSQPLKSGRNFSSGKDLPVDVTQLVQQGINTLEISHNCRPNDKAVMEYAVAVESIEVLSLEKIVALVRCNIIDRSTVLAAIKSTLSPSSGTDSQDDDLILLSESITISLRDPLSLAAIPVMPVRGKDCKHHECFDLATFLQSRTRNSIPKNSPILFGDAPTSKVDVWRCPICNCDVRPVNMRLDGWMLDLREELERKGLLEVESVSVGADGSWRVNDLDDDRIAVGQTSTSNGQAASTRLEATTEDRKKPSSIAFAKPGIKNKKEIVVIDLEDD